MPPLHSSRVRLLAALAIVAVAGCRSSRETNLGFHLDRNQPVLSTILIEGYPGRFVVSSALPRTVVSSQYIARHGIDRLSTLDVLIGETIRREIDPNILDMGDQIDALIGLDLLGPVFSIDYRRGTVSSSDGADLITPEMVMHRYSNQPALPLTIEGSIYVGVVDTALPDTMVIPFGLIDGMERGRGTVQAEVGRVRFVDLDVLVADVSELRVGNRVLAKFLITIDTRAKKIGLWEY